MLAIVTSAAALLLAVAGVSKLRAPATAAALLADLGRRSGLRRTPALRAAVRLAGLAEAAVGVLVLAHGGRTAVILLAACYAIFVVVSALGILAARRNASAPRSSCGCFGAADAPLGGAHLVLTAACLGVAAGAAVRPFGGGAGLDGAAWPTVVTAGLQIALLAGLGYLSITSLPALLSARRLTEAP